MDRFPKSGGVLVLGRVEIVSNWGFDGVPVCVENTGVVEEDFANISNISSGSLAYVGSCSTVDVNGFFTVSSKSSKLFHIG